MTRWCHQTISVLDCLSPGLFYTSETIKSYPAQVSDLACHTNEIPSDKPHLTYKVSEALKICLSERSQG